MKQKIEKLRAHHGMCLCFYKGKGYSSDFTDNMWDALDYLQKENPEVEIVDRDDHICASCPNLLPLQESDGQTASSFQCDSTEKVTFYDNEVLKACGLNSGDRMRWKDYQALVQKKIIQSGKREMICGNCSWTELCK